MENRNIPKEVVEEDKTREAKNVSLLGLECILFYLDYRKRLELSLDYPMFRILEKRVPLTLDSLNISLDEIEIDGTTYKFDYNDNNIHEITTVVKPGKIVEDVVHLGVFRFAQKLFIGRNRFRVGKFELGFVIPFKLSIDCDTVIVDLFDSNAANYSNVIQKVDCLDIGYFRSPDDIDYPWIQKANEVKVDSDELEYFLPVLPKIPAKTVVVEFDSYSEKFDRLIRVWCESRNGRVGSLLFMITWAHRDKYFSQFAQMGFIEDSDERWRRPLKNDSVARLSIKDDFDSLLEKYYLYSDDRDEYFRLEIVR